MSNKNETGILIKSLGISLVTFTFSLLWFLIIPSHCWGTFSEIDNLPTDSFYYSGIELWEPISENVDPVIEKIYANEFQLHYHPASSSTEALDEVLNDEVHFTIISEREIADDHKTALEQIPVAIDGIAVVINPELEKVSGLTISQLQKIYEGKITNWQQLEGPDLAIKPYSTNHQARRNWFLNEIVEEQDFAEKNVESIDHSHAAEIIANQSGAIYYAAAQKIIADCRVKPLAIGESPDQLIRPYEKPWVSCQQKTASNALNWSAFQEPLFSHFQQKYPLTQTLSIVTKRNEQAGKPYGELLRTQQGQSLLQGLGLVPICQNH